MEQLPPFSVIPYHQDHIISFIRHKTNWNNRSEIANKKQLRYLFSYLESDHVKAQTTILENEYIEKYYLEDYAEYYARCFNQHPRFCSRIHFFSFQFDEDFFLSALEDANSSEYKKLIHPDSYLGFIVIRPIPSTFLSRVCITPYKALLSSENYKLMQRPYAVSLFGIKLKIKTVAFQEQDKVVAACATSALWAFLNASEQICHSQIPSPSSITKSAIPADTDGTRTFPNKGLKPNQIAKSLKYYGFEPTVYPYGKSGMEDLYEILEEIYAYTSSDIPVLIGGTIYKQNKGVINKCLGQHLLCILGYKLNKNFSFDNCEGLKVKAHAIEKIYVHDDRYGPFARVEIKIETCTEDEGGKLEHKGLFMSHYFDSEDLFVPDLVIIGLYHKIRITYHEIINICRTFNVIIELYLGVSEYFSKNIRITAEKFFNATHDVSLVTNTKIKEEIAACKQWKSSSFGDEKKYLLEKHLPKYLWRCQFHYDSELLSELYFDATEIPQGKILIGFSSYAEDAALFWHFINAEIKKDAWSEFYNKAEDEQKTAVSCFIRYFSTPGKDISLDVLYGPTNLPKRSLKDGEYDHYKNIQKRKDIYKISRDGEINLDSLKLEPNKTYIWVINKYGDLILGLDIYDPCKNEYQGHPTLVDGEPARIGGEIKFSKQKNKWVINSKSRAYSAHIRTQQSQNSYLQNVLRKFNQPETKIEIELL